MPNTDDRTQSPDDHSVEPCTRRVAHPSASEVAGRLDAVINHNDTSHPRASLDTPVRPVVIPPEAPLSAAADSLLIDLFCGRGGWSRPWLPHAIGYDCHDHGYPATLLVRKLPCDPGELARHQPTLIVASPPCEEFARHHLPWIHGPEPSLELLRWSLSLIGKCGCPVIVECSHFAARHVPGAILCGSYALWGDVPALLPTVPRRKMKSSGTDPARRAMIEPALAEWIHHVYS